MMKISLSGFLFEDNYNSQSLSIEEFCTLAESAGYDGVELRRTQVNIDSNINDRKKIHEIVKEHRLEVTCLTARGMPKSGQERDAFFERYLNLCRDLECRRLKISGDTKWLKSAAQKALEYNVMLVTNNHIGSQLETIEGTKNYFSEIDHPNMGLLYDPYHLMINGEDYINAISEFEDWIQTVLMQSVRLSNNEDGMFEYKGQYWIRALPHEEGVQDWKEIFKKLKIHKYKGYITVIENSWPQNQHEHVARECAKFIKGCL